MNKKKFKFLIFGGLFTILFLLVIVFIAVSGKLNIPFIRIILPQEIWSIGIYKFYDDGNILKVLPHSEVNNPVLTAEDITDRKAKFVADPFLVYENDTYHMFFEVLNQDNGDIGLAVSRDGLQWEYKKIVLDEPFHLSYPCVFKWQESYYMIPESCQDKSIRLYKAEHFPYKWHFVKKIIEGERFSDPTIFHWQHRWWLFACTNQHSTLHLYYADSLEGSWMKHPQSPIVKDNSNIARCGGNVIFWNGDLIRIAQDDFPSYGNAIRAFEIIKLTLNEYEEHELKYSPLLRGDGSGWNSKGMHQLSCVAVDKDERLCVVDGKKYGSPLYLGIGKFLKIRMPNIVYRTWESLRNL